MISTLSLPGWVLHNVCVFIPIFVKELENFVEAIVYTRRTDTIGPVDSLDS